MSWFLAWAKAASLTGRVNFEGMVTRQVLFSSIALSYLRIKDEPSHKAADRAAVDAWICRVGRILHTDYQTTYANSRSNLMYAAGEIVTIGPISYFCLNSPSSKHNVVNTWVFCSTPYVITDNQSYDAATPVPFIYNQVWLSWQLQLVATTWSCSTGRQQSLSASSSTKSSLTDAFPWRSPEGKWPHPITPLQQRRLQQCPTWPLPMGLICTPRVTMPSVASTRSWPSECL